MRTKDSGQGYEIPINDDGKPTLAVSDLVPFGSMLKDDRTAAPAAPLSCCVFGIPVPLQERIAEMRAALGAQVPRDDYEAAVERLDEVEEQIREQIGDNVPLQPVDQIYLCWN